MDRRDRDGEVDQAAKFTYEVKGFSSHKIATSEEFYLDAKGKVVTSPQDAAKALLLDLDPEGNIVRIVLDLDPKNKVNN